MAHLDRANSLFIQAGVPSQGSVGCMDKEGVIGPWTALPGGLKAYLARAALGERVSAPG